MTRPDNAVVINNTSIKEQRNQKFLKQQYNDVDDTKAKNY